MYDMQDYLTRWLIFDGDMTTRWKVKMVQRCDVDYQIADRKNVNKTSENIKFIMLLSTSPAVLLGDCQHRLG
jgi:hypothetical protein